MSEAPVNMLVSLYPGYGMGDAVQLSSVLRHLRKHRPHWRVDYQAPEGQHQAGRGLVANHFATGTPYPSDHYDREVQVVLFDTWANWGDRPNTRVSSTLHERFGLEWDRECGRYHVEVSESAAAMASVLTCQDHGLVKGKNYRRVAIHYQGDSSPDKKNLTHDQALVLCRQVERLGYTPMLLDWRGQSPLPSRHHVLTVGGKSFSEKWGGNIEMNCAVISQCAAFVGIDSGPSKCASATDTPALVIWTGHHPAPFHDPAPNTTHLCPRGYHGLYPVCDSPSVIAWFERHYAVRHYEGDPVREACLWLEGVLE